MSLRIVNKNNLDKVLVDSIIFVNYKLEFRSTTTSMNIKLRHARGVEVAKANQHLVAEANVLVTERGVAVAPLQMV